MKKYLILLTLIFLHQVSFGQETDLIASDSTWTKEHFTFPLSFAQKINFQGVEEAVFPAGWGNTESSEFWSYAFAWKIDADNPLTESEIETNLQYYFDGLLGLELDRQEPLEVQNSTALFIRTNYKHNTATYSGKIRTFDTRLSQRPLTLHVLADQYYCKSERKNFILFRFSPASHDLYIWSTLKALTLHERKCPD